jgi:hypothetical protein
MYEKITYYYYRYYEETLLLHVEYFPKAVATKRNIVVYANILLVI